MRVLITWLMTEQIKMLRKANKMIKETIFLYICPAILKNRERERVYSCGLLLTFIHHFFFCHFYPLGPLSFLYISLSPSKLWYKSTKKIQTIQNLKVSKREEQEIVWLITAEESKYIPHQTKPNKN